MKSIRIEDGDDAILELRGHGPLWSAVADLLDAERTELRARAQAAEDALRELVEAVTDHREAQQAVLRAGGPGDTAQENDRVIRAVIAGRNLLEADNVS